jgi:hypothetical protein
LGFRAEGLGFRVKVSEVKLKGLRLRAQDFGFKVQGLKLIVEGGGLEG